MAFKVKMKGIEGDAEGEGLNWLLREAKVLRGVRLYFQMRGEV